MTQKDIELILLRQWASHLALPVFLCGPDGQLLFYNEPAETLLGVRYDEAGEMPLDRLSTIFRTVDESGKRIRSEELPIGIALKHARPSHQRLRFRALDGVSHTIEVTAIPLTAQGGRNLGVVVFFWEDMP